MLHSGRVVSGFEVIDELKNKKIYIKEDIKDLNEFKDKVKIKSVDVELNGNPERDVKIHKKFDINEFILNLVNPNKRN